MPTRRSTLSATAVALTAGLMGAPLVTRGQQVSGSPELEDHYADVNGIRLHYKSAGKGKLILFLHGFPEFWGRMEKSAGRFWVRRSASRPRYARIQSLLQASRS